MNSLQPASVLPFSLPAPDPQRPPGTRRPHPPETVAAVRLLYERTALVYREIAARTGVAPATIRSWAAADDWRRPPGAATARLRYQKGMPPHRLRGVPLARRMREIAERYVTEMESDPRIDLGGLSTAFTMLEMAREEEQAAYRRRKSFVWRARVAAERLLDHMERHPEESDHHDLAWVVEMLRMIKEEEAERKRKRERSARSSR